LTPKQIFESLLSRMEPRLAAAFASAVQGIRDRVNYSELVGLIQSGAIEDAVRSLGIDPVAYEPFIDAFRDEYVAAGRFQTDNLPVEVGRLLFSGRNVRAEQFLAEASAELVTRTVESQRQAVRDALVAGMERGAAPRSLATQIVGSVSRTTGRREGGILGLTADGAKYVDNARQELVSGRYADYLQREQRDRRYDKVIRAAIRSGERLPYEMTEVITFAYEKKLLALRGRTVARTEAMTALHASQHESLLQAVDQGVVRESAITRIWRDASDLRVRHTHRGLDGQRVSLRQPFVSPSGALLLYPGDPKARASERINCRCWCETVIDFFADLT
jgi:hypothetical protein